MKPPHPLCRRTFLSLPLALSLFESGLAHGQTGRTSRWIVPVPAGGGMDASARLIAEHVRDALGVIVVENRPGAALRLGVDAVKRAEPDGLTLLFAPASPFTIYPHIYKKLAYDVRTDFVPVSAVCSFDFALGVPGNSPINSLADYVAAVRRDAATQGLYAVPAAGAAPHFAGAQFARAAGIEAKHVPYKGSAPAMQDLIGGHVPAAFNLTGEFVPYMGDKKVKVLATTGQRRSPFMPNVPTFAELGYKDMVLSEWFGLFAPANTPKAVVDKIDEAVQNALRKPEVVARFGVSGYTPMPLSSAEVRDRLVGDIKVWGPIIKATGFTVDE